MPPRQVHAGDEPRRRSHTESHYSEGRKRSRSRDVPRRASSRERRRAPPSPPSSDSSSRRVHWPDDPADPRYDARGRASERSDSYQSRSRTRSATRSPSRDVVEHHYYHPRPLQQDDRLDKEDKPWFKKKTVWTTVASLATVAALVPTTLSANASVDAANAASRSAKNTKRAAAAGEQSARASILSARAVNNTTMAQGHQDRYGRYTGPSRHVRPTAHGVGYGGGARREIIW